MPILLGHLSCKTTCFLKIKILLFVINDYGNNWYQNSVKLLPGIEDRRLVKAIGLTKEEVTSSCVIR
ncbi:hypothetical protein L1987_44660 [Smallanthus sonchifolius]|uniref:Uncharacterized protein n=1 Tax=Smallanthus sonchifolius TaxID=185202 RepID=A0ACB9GQQ3_9ASTR|nr:hypothetical protein L1987_44660 [Smallanthus sonchifolius]